MTERLLRFDCSSSDFRDTIKEKGGLSMIMQRFIPISPLLNNLLELSFQTFSPICPELDSLDFQEIDAQIILGESSFFAITDHLAALTSDSEVTAYICSLSPEQALLLYAGIQISFLHFHADTQLLPAIPSGQFYQSLFAYLQAGYLSFKKYCDLHQLSIWESIIDYENHADKHLS